MSQGRDDGSWSLQKIGGKAAIVLFALMLAAFVVETELTQYVQTQLDYRQTYFLFYVAHSSFTFIFPLHLLVLKLSTPHSARAYVHRLGLALNQQLSPTSTQRASDSAQFPLAQFAALIVWLTIGVTGPSLLWFAAIALASANDVTAIWNSNAFWAYFLSVKLNHHPWEPKKLAAVLIAIVGVLTVVYGSEEQAEIAPEQDTNALIRTLQGSTPAAPLMGNALTLLASVGYGLYQVLYKKYAALPEDFARGGGVWRQLSVSSLSESLLPGEDHEESDVDVVQAVPFALHPNLLTSCTGLLTFCVLWIPLPILHFLSIEPFMLPPDAWTALCVCGIAATSMTFYMTFMILLGIWGAIVTSVGNLLTIVLVLVVDAVFGSAVGQLTYWSIVGSSMIICAFVVLAYDTFRA